MASVSLWITMPHQGATWLRTYGLTEDWQRFRGRLIVAPILLFATAVVGLQWAPITLMIIIMLWDHQHSIMQQHGFARIYDFKAGTGATGRFDLLLNWVLYVNLFLTAPMFTRIWMEELFRFGIPPSSGVVRTIHMTSWTITGMFASVYLGYLVRCVREGISINPIKYLFFGASYFLWYFTAWLTESVLVHGIAHRLMHGMQYLVIVYVYLQHKRSKLGNKVTTRERWMLPGSVKAFLLMGFIYAVFYHLLTAQPLEQFGFGVVNFLENYPGHPESRYEGMTPQVGYELFAATIINSTGLIHYYFDSFIWKVSDTKTQEGL